MTRILRIARINHEKGVGQGKNVVRSGCACILLGNKSDESPTKPK